MYLKGNPHEMFLKSKIERENKTKKFKRKIYQQPQK